MRVKDAYLSACYARLVERRGKKKAVVAVAHKILGIADTLIRMLHPSSPDFDQPYRRSSARRWLASLRGLWYSWGDAGVAQW